VSKFKKIPVTIDAVQITDATFDALHPNPDHIPGIRYDPIFRCAYINTLEGVMTASLGDWIITGVKGEHYSCKRDIFALTYEKVYTYEDPKLQLIQEWCGPPQPLKGSEWMCDGDGSAYFATATHYSDIPYSTTITPSWATHAIYFGK
jgi:hypothetical protein